MSQGGALNNKGGGGGSGIQTIDGDTGSITGSTVTIYADNAANTQGATVLFANSGTTSQLLLTDGLDNIAIGRIAGSQVAGQDNVAIGPGAVSSITTNFGQRNVGIGRFALQAITNTGDNTAVGVDCFKNVATGVGNCGLGRQAGEGFIDSASYNVCIGLGTSSLSDDVTGSYNMFLGYLSGTDYSSSESSNILIGNLGVNGESNVMRLGTQGTGNQQVDSCFIAGITGATPTSGNTPQVVVCDNAGNLTPIDSSTAGYVLTSNGTSTPSFQPASGGGAGSPVSFQAYLTSPQTNTGGSPATVVFDTPINNVGGGYDPSTGIFTAPVTGVYNFSTVTYFYDLSSLTGFHQAIVGYTGSAQSLRIFEVSDISVSSIELALTGSWSMPMTAGDEVKIDVDADGTGTYEIYGEPLGNAPFGTSSTFSGFLVAASPPTVPSVIFSAALTNTISNVTGDNTTYTVICDNVYQNIGSAYDNTTGLFTAPVTGLYLFTGSVYFRGLNTLSPDILNVALISGGGQYNPISTQLGQAYQTQTPGDYALTFSQMIQMTATDTMSLTVLVGGGTKTVDLSGLFAGSGLSTSFSGMSIGF